MSDVSGMDNSEEEIEFEIINNCIEYVYDQDSVYADFSKEEMIEWLSNLKQDQFNKIRDFFDEMPKLSYEIKWKCQQCGEDDSVTLEGLSSFFI